MDWNGKRVKGIRHLENPKIKKYHKQIKEGKSFLEAVKTGVTLSTIDAFIKNLDDVSVMRRKSVVPTKDKKYIADRILASIGQMESNTTLTLISITVIKLSAQMLFNLLFQQLNFLLKKALVVLQQHLTLSQERVSVVVNSK